MWTASYWTNSYWTASYWTPVGGTRPSAALRSLRGLLPLVDQMSARDRGHYFSATALSWPKEPRDRVVETADELAHVEPMFEWEIEAEEAAARAAARAIIKVPPYRMPPSPPALDKVDAPTIGRDLMSAAILAEAAFKNEMMAARLAEIEALNESLPRRRAFAMLLLMP